MRTEVGEDETAREESPSVRAWATVLYFVVLSVICAFVFAPSMRIGFFEDDFGYLALTLRDDWWRTSPIWDFSSQVLRPVTAISIGVQKEIFGLNPYPFHVVALGLVILQGVLLYFVALRIGLTVVGARIAAAILMLHTTNGWTVMWTASTSSLYVVNLGLIVVFLMADDQVRRRQVVAATVAFAFALLAREISIMIPPIVMLIRAVRASGTPPVKARKALLETRALWVLLGLSTGARLVASGYARSKPEVPRLVPILDWTSFSAALPDSPVHLRDLLILATAPFRSDFDEAGLHVEAPFLLVAAIIWVVLVVLVVREARAGRWIGSIGLGWFLIAIVPPVLLQPELTYGNYADLAIPGLALAFGSVAQPIAQAVPVRVRPVAGVIALGAWAWIAFNGGNCLIKPPPPFIIRARELQEQVLRDYPDPPPGATIVITDALPEDPLWTSNGDQFRLLFDDPDLVVEFQPEQP